MSKITPEHVEITPEYVAMLLRTQGLDRTGLMTKEGDTMNDRITIGLFASNPQLMITPIPTQPGLKQEYLMVVGPANADDRIVSRDGAAGFWQDVLDIIDTLDTEPIIPGLTSSTKSDEYLELLTHKRDGIYYANSSTREGIVKARRGAYTYQLQVGDILPGTTFREFVGDDTWIGYVDEDEGLE